MLPTREKNVCAIMFEGFRVVMVLFRHVSSTVPMVMIVRRRRRKRRPGVLALLTMPLLPMMMTAVS